MGQRSQIYVRYHVGEEKKLIAKYFGWNYGERMISRARWGMELILEDVRKNTAYQNECQEKRLSEIFDVNFDFPKENILSGNITLDYIPDMYIEGYMNFMLYDDLKNQYSVPDSVIAKLSECALDEWYPILKKECTNAVVSDLQYLERISSLTSGQALDAMTEEEFETVVDRSESVKNDVNAYERKLKVQEEMLEYIGTLFYQHDMAAWRNLENRKRQQKVADKCMETLLTHPDLFETLESKQQIMYFVRQTILYMV